MRAPHNFRASLALWTTSERSECGAAHARLRNLTCRRDPVANVNNTRGKGLCLDQLQIDAVVQGREVGGAAAQDDRGDEKPVLVDETQLYAGGSQASAADGQVLTRLLL